MLKLSRKQANLIIDCNNLRSAAPVNVVCECESCGEISDFPHDETYIKSQYLDGMECSECGAPMLYVIECTVKFFQDTYLIEE